MDDKIIISCSLPASEICLFFCHILPSLFVYFYTRLEQSLSTSSVFYSFNQAVKTKRSKTPCVVSFGNYPLRLCEHLIKSNLAVCM